MDHVDSEALLDLLCGLQPAQLDAVIIRARLPHAQVAPAPASVKQRAVEMVQVAAQGGQPLLAQVADAAAREVASVAGAAAASQHETPEAAEAQAAALAAASQPMAHWPQTLPTGEWLDRPEVGELLARLRQPEPRPLLLLGGPGSGKSALLGRLTNKLTEAGTVVLAIRADRLTRDVDNLAGLQRWLQLPEAAAVLLRRAAARGRAALILDQLDALADLCDAHTHRLDVLLRLVDEVRRTPGLGVVLSCRDFEFRHDQRFRSLQAEHLTLAPLPQDAVTSTLQRRGLDPRALSATLVEGLRAPQTLAMFLRYMEGKTQAPAFDTYQQVLEGLWDERVIRRDGGQRRAEAIGAIARHMADEEELSVPYAALARFSAEILELEAADILRRDDPRRVAFTHQTWFAFARARSFVLGEERLSEHVRLNGGSLFVRATVSAAMVNLRETRRRRYHEELHTMWAAADLRIHLRTLFVQLLGAQHEPDDQEAALLLPELRREGYLRRVILNAIAGSPGWFRRIAAHLPVLMTGPNAAEVWGLLARALAFDRARVLDLVEQHWLHEPSRGMLAFSVFRYVKPWDDRALALVLAVCRHGDAIGSQHRMLTSMLVREMADPDPERALRVVRAALNQDLARCQAKAQETVSSQPARWDDPVRKLVEHDHGFHGLTDFAKKAPMAFMREIWPWLVDALEDLAEPADEYTTTYRQDHVFGGPKVMSDHVPVRELPHAAEIAVAAAAREFSEDFLALAGRWHARDILAVHVVLARGLQEVGDSKAGWIARYLIGDPRRLLLGSSDDPIVTTVGLLEKVAPHLDKELIAQLEAAILSSRRYSNRPESDVRWRHQRQRHNRRHQMRLLAALQKSPFLSTGSRASIEREGRALADLRGPEGVRFWFGESESPMRAAQMQRAADEHIVNLFDELAKRPDETRSADRVPWSSVLASRELALMAKEDPQRALTLAATLRPGIHELPAAHMIEELSRGSTPERAQILEDLILLLEERGFSTKDYREQVAWALHNLAKALPLSERTLDILQGWLGEDAREESARSPESKRGGEPRSVLLGHGAMHALPHGNFPALLALTDACLRREDAVLHARWVSILESHLSRKEQPAVWQALLEYLKYLSNDMTLVSLTDQLFERYPTVRDCVEGVHHIANLRHRADPDRLHRWLEELRHGPWSRGAQAYGEMLVLLAAQRSDLGWATQAVYTYLEPGAAMADGDQVRLGLAYIAVELWPEPEARPVCTDILLRLLALASGEVAKAVMGVFGRRHEVLPDEATNKVLDAVLRHRALLPAADVHGLVSQLERLCTLEPDRTLALCNALLDEAERAPDAVPSLGSAAREFIDISLTLQRLPGHRDTGLDLFERMLKLGLYGVHETLQELNVRPDAEPTPPRWR